MLSGEDFLNEILGTHEEQTQPNSDDNSMDSLLGITPPSETDSTNETEVSNNADTPPVETETEDVVAPKRFSIKDSINKLIETETWVDMPLRYDGKEYDSIDDLLAKEKINNELFEALSSAQKSYKQEQINTEYLSIKDQDETKVKLAKAIMTGADYTDLLGYNKDVLEPIVAIDFANIENNEAVSEAFVRQCLVELDNIPAKYIDIEIDGLKKDFKLIEKAEEYQNILVANFNKEVEDRHQAELDRVANEIAETKENIKELRAVLKGDNLTEPFIQKIVKLRYTKDNDGEYHYEKLIKDKIKDKSFEARLMHFLLDDEDLIKKEKSKVKIEAAVKYMEIVNNSNKEVKSGNASQGNLQTDEEDFLRQIGISNSYS